jgi:hypothetical protein
MARRLSPEDFKLALAAKAASEKAFLLNEQRNCEGQALIAQLKLKYEAEPGDILDFESGELVTPTELADRGAARGRKMRVG